MTCSTVNPSQTHVMLVCSVSYGMMMMMTIPNQRRPAVRRVLRSSSRTDTPVDPAMLSSGGAQSLRPASAPGEDAPTPELADSTEVIRGLSGSILMRASVHEGHGAGGPALFWGQMSHCSMVLDLLRDPQGDCR